MILHTFRNILVKKLFGNDLLHRFAKYFITFPYYIPSNSTNALFSCRTRSRHCASLVNIIQRNNKENLRSTWSRPCATRYHEIKSPNDCVNAWRKWCPGCVQCDHWNQFVLQRDWFVEFVTSRVSVCLWKRGWKGQISRPNFPGSHRIEDGRDVIHFSLFLIKHANQSTPIMNNSKVFIIIVVMDITDGVMEYNYVGWYFRK